MTDVYLKKIYLIGSPCRTHQFISHFLNIVTNQSLAVSMLQAYITILFCACQPSFKIFGMKIHILTKLFERVIYVKREEEAKWVFQREGKTVTDTNVKLTVNATAKPLKCTTRQRKKLRRNF